MRSEVTKMFNLIKMNLYRVFHQKAFYIVPVSMAMVCGFLVYITWLTPRLERQAVEMTGQSGIQAGIVVGSTADESFPLTEDFDLTIFMDLLFDSGMLGLLISIGASIITNAERKHGFIKNIAGQISPRGMMAPAKLPGMLLECFLILAFAVLGAALSGKIFYAGFTFGNLAALTKALAVQLLLGFALCAFIMMICTLSENAAAGIITGIILSMNMLPLLYMLINTVLWNYLHVPESFDITRYTLSTHLMSVSSTSEPDTLGLALAVGAAYLVVYSLGASVILKKKDIA